MWGSATTQAEPQNLVSISLRGFWSQNRRPLLRNTRLLTFAPQSETLPRDKGMGRRIMMRISALLMGLFAGLIVMAAPGASRAEPATVAAHAHGLTAEEFSAQSRRIIRRAPRRVPIYRGSSYPGPNAVRVCNAHYEQEYRPSGTVIVPRMQCYWRG